MIFNGIKRRWLRKELEKIQKNQDRPSLKWPESMIVICDGQQSLELDKFLGWAKELGIKKEAVTCIAYVQDKRKSTLNDVVLVDKKLIKWSGGITDAEVKKLLKKSFDLQINYYDKPNELLEFISLALPSRLKVGYMVDEESVYDLSISVKLNDFNGFLKELIKYLKILTQ